MILGHSHSPRRLQLCAFAFSERPFLKGERPRRCTLSPSWTPWAGTYLQKPGVHCSLSLYSHICPTATELPVPQIPPNNASLSWNSLHPTRMHWNPVSLESQPTTVVYIQMSPVWSPQTRPGKDEQCLGPKWHVLQEKNFNYSNGLRARQNYVTVSNM